MEQHNRYSHLDGLRALAVSLVVFHHSCTVVLVDLGNYLGLTYLSKLIPHFTQSGVELFFVLSGVLMLSPYVNSQKKFNALNYFKRRLLRIYPPYFVALVFGAFVIWIIKTFPTWYSDVITFFSWKSTFNQLPIVTLSTKYYNLAWWSLQIELLFYMLVPVIILIYSIFPKNLQRFLVMIGILIIGLTFFQLFLSKTIPNYYGVQILKLNLIKFIDYPVCFLTGVFICSKERSLKDASYLIALGLILVALSGIYIPFTHSGFGLIYGGVIILSFKIEKIKQFLSSPFLVWLGERSYSLFLTHFSVFYLTNYFVSHFIFERDLVYGIFTRGIGISLSLLVAMCLFHFVERRQAKGLLTANMFWPVWKFPVKNRTNAQAIA